MPGKTGFQLVASDVSLLQHVYELRLATIHHVATLSGRSYKQSQKRLVKLQERGYVVVLTRRPQRHVFAIGREGVALLIEHGYAPREIAERRLRHNELKELGIQHALFIADIHVKILQITRAASLTIADWVEGPSLWDSVTTGANEAMPVRPDAWFTIAQEQSKTHFFLEADRGTMAHSRMREKINGYAAYFQQQRHVKKYPGMKTFRVATITETRGRAEGLLTEFRGMMPAAWLNAYPVIAFEDLTLDSLLPGLKK